MFERLSVWVFECLRVDQLSVESVESVEIVEIFACCVCGTGDRNV
jgi:hypothetical protein